MSGRRILVTGAAGFVGQHVMTELARSGYSVDEIVALSRPGEELPKPHPNVMFVDIADPGAVREAIAKVRPTGVIHLAAISEPAKAKAEPRVAWDINFLGVMHLAEALLAIAPQARFVFAGTSESYGDSFLTFPSPVSEETPLSPRSAYAATKAAAEIYLGQKSHEGLQVVRFRAFNHTGPGQTANFVAPAFARQIARIEAGRDAPTIKVGNLESERDFLDVRDVARAYVLGLEKPASPGVRSVMNLSSGKPQRIGAMLEYMLANSQARISVEVDKDRIRPNDIPRTIGDNRRAQSELGWSPTIEFEQTLKDVLADWRLRVGKERE